MWIFSSDVPHVMVQQVYVQTFFNPYLRVGEGPRGWVGNEAFALAQDLNLELDNLSCCHCHHLSMAVLGIVAIYHPWGSNSFKMSIEALPCSMV